MIKKLIPYIFIILFSSYMNISLAQDHYSGDGFDVSLENSGQYAILSFKLKDQVKFYWRNPGELGLATNFNFNKSLNLESAKLSWPIPEIHQNYNVSSYIYSGKVKFPIKTIAKNNEKNITLNVNASFSLCNKTCNNYDITLSTLINPNNKNISNELEELLNSMPNQNSEELKIYSLEQEVIAGQHWLNIKVNSTRNLVNPQIFLDLPKYISFDPTKFNLKKIKNGQVISFPFYMIGKKHTQIEDVIYLNLVADNGHLIEYEAKPTLVNHPESDSSFLLIILYALIGGLILNVMPCVLPILALKALQIVNLQNQKRSIISLSLLAQSAGIIISFISLAFIAYALQQLGFQAGLGLHFQQPFYLITMAIVLAFISIYLVTNVKFHVSTPHFIVNLFPKTHEALGILGFFLTGVLSTLLGIPCTAPFVTIAIGFALTTSFIKMLIVFTAMGIGMSIPYLIMAVFPKAAKILPKPGHWMVKFKKILGIIIFISCLWLIYILSTQLGYKAALCLFLLILLIKFVLTEKEKNISNKVKSIILAILIILSYFVPSHLYQEKYEKEIIIEETWQDYDPELIDTLIKQNHIILLDVTASWCATCSVNKLTTLNNSAVINYIEKMSIVTMRADISKSTSSQVSNLMRTHNHFGIPLHVIYSKKHPQGVVLPSILLPKTLISAIKAEL